MSDIRIYTTSGIYAGTTDSSEFMLPSPLADTVTTRLETICGKVVKFLLTGKGTDSFNPQYGSYLTTYNQISEAYLPRLHVELLEDIRRCTSFIKLAEAKETPSEENLQRIRLVNLVYNKNTRDRIDLYIEVISTHSNSALLTVPIEVN